MQIFGFCLEERRPHLAQEIDSQFLIEPRLMDNLPPGLKVDEVWVIDRAIPSAQLGPGAFEWFTGVSAALEVASEDNYAAGAPAMSQKAVGQPPKVSLIDATMQSCAGADPGRLLDRLNSEYQAESDVFEGITRATQRAMDVGRYFSDDLQDTSTIEYWLRSHVSHLKGSIAISHFQCPSPRIRPPLPAFVQLAFLFSST